MKNIIALKIKKYKLLVYSLLLINCLLILYLGLNTKGQGWQNTVVEDKSGGLIFSRGSFAYKNINLTEKEDILSPINYLSVTVELEANTNSNQVRNIIRMISGNNSRGDIYLFQWKDYIIMSLGKDYDRRKKYPRVSKQLSSNNPHKIQFEVFDKQINLYYQNQLVDSNRDEKIGLYFDETILVKLSDFATLQRAWQGELSFLSINLGEDKNNNSAILEYRGVSSEDQFLLPSYPVFFDRELFSFPEMISAWFKTFAFDIFFNLIGFVPVALLFMHILLNNGIQPKASLLMVCFSVFIFSLAIEYGQSWMPARNSSIVDLLLNTLGGILGANFVYFFRNNKIFGK